MTNSACAWYNYGEIISHLYREARYASGKTVRSRIMSHESVLGVRLIKCGDYVRCAFDCIIPGGSGLTESAAKAEIERFLQVKHLDYHCSINFDSSYAPIQRSGSSED